MLVSQYSAETGTPAYSHESIGCSSGFVNVNRQAKEMNNVYNGCTPKWDSYPHYRNAPTSKENWGPSISLELTTKIVGQWTSGYSHVGIPSISLELATKLVGLKRSYNWNKRRAKAITEATCYNAVSLVNNACAQYVPQPVVVTPSPRGVIIIEWHVGKQSILLAEVSSDPNKIKVQFAYGKSESTEEMVNLRGFLSRLIDLTNRK